MPPSPGPYAECKASRRGPRNRHKIVLELLQVFRTREGALSVRKYFIPVILMAVGGAPVAHADGNVTVPADSLIAARQAGMDLQVALAGAIKRGIESKAEVKPFKDAGDGIAAWGKAIPGLFPAGTEKGHKTRALPVIWSDRAGFEKAAANLTEAAETMAKAAEAGNSAEFATAFQATGQACAACHRTYRAR